MYLELKKIQIFTFFVNNPNSRMCYLSAAVSVSLQLERCGDKCLVGVQMLQRSRLRNDDSPRHDSPLLKQGVVGSVCIPQDLSMCPAITMQLHQQSNILEHHRLMSFKTYRHWSNVAKIFGPRVNT